MNRLVKSSLGVVFVILSGPSAWAIPQPSVPSATQTLEQSNATPGLVATLVGGQGPEVVGGGAYAGRFSAAATTSAVPNEGKSQPATTDGLSMLVALVIMGGFVLRRFWR
jgi:hypothetical protein